MNNTKKRFIPAICLLVAFSLWTLTINFVDVQAIGPENTSVGFATINRLFHTFTGVHMALYTITDWLGLIPVAVVLGFALLGLVQWIQRKSLGKVDRNLFVLGAFYILVIGGYLLFEEIVINYRPILIEGRLEASYPSSTTLLTLCVMPTAILQLMQRIQNRRLKTWVAIVITLFTAFMVIGRLLSGVHWLTDVVGGILLSAGLVLLYHAASELTS